MTQAVQYKDTGATTLLAAMAAVEKKSLGQLTDLVLPAGAYPLGDFIDYNAAAQTRHVNLRGAGEENTVIQLKGPFTTKVDPSWLTIPFYGIASNGGLPIVLEGFTLDCSGVSPDQHLFGGIRVGDATKRAQAPRINNVRLVGNLGARNTPPGETFGINLWRVDNPMLDTVEVDGASRGAAGIGLNDVTGLVGRMITSHGSAHSHGMTFWESHGALLSDVDLSHNGVGVGGDAGAGLNLERSSGVAVRRGRLGSNSLACVRMFTDDVAGWPCTGHSLVDVLGYDSAYSVLTEGAATLAGITVDSLTSRLVGVTGYR